MSVTSVPSSEISATITSPRKPSTTPKRFGNPVVDSSQVVANGSYEVAPMPRTEYKSTSATAYQRDGSTKETSSTPRVGVYLDASA